MAMDYMDGVPLESLVDDTPQKARDAVGVLLQKLMFRELFEFRVMQTDPNFANYLYEPSSGRLVLLDFGATQEFTVEFSERFRRITRAIVDGDRRGIEDRRTPHRLHRRRRIPEGGAGRARRTRTGVRAAAGDRGRTTTAHRTCPGAHASWASTWHSSADCCACHRRTRCSCTASWSACTCCWRGSAHAFRPDASSGRIWSPSWR